MGFNALRSETARWLPRGRQRRSNSLCWKCLWLAIEADYLSYEKGKVAAVKMSNKPMFFADFAATIRHDDLKDGRSKVTYIYHFDAKPRCLAFLLEPIMKFCLNREVTHRLAALKRFAENC